MRPEFKIKKKNISRNTIVSRQFSQTGEAWGQGKQSIYEPLCEATIFQALWNVCFVIDSGDPSCISSLLPAKNLSGLTSHDNSSLQIKTVC